MISSYAMELLMEYPFPGNIRELENIIERGVAMETSNIILPENLVLLAEEEAEQKQIDLHIPDSGIDLNAELEKIEQQLDEAKQRHNAYLTELGLSPLP